MKIEDFDTTKPKIRKRLRSEKRSCEMEISNFPRSSNIDDILFSCELLHSGQEITHEIIGKNSYQSVYPILQTMRTIGLTDEENNSKDIVTTESSDKSEPLKIPDPPEQPISLDSSLFDKINHTQTTLGKLQLMHTVTNPTDNVRLLNSRKEVILNFCENPDMLHYIIDKLAEIKKGEGQALWFFKPISSEMEKVLDVVYFQNFWNSWLNTQETFMNWYYYFTIIIYPIYGILAPIFFFILPFVFMRYIYKIKNAP